MAPVSLVAPTARTAPIGVTPLAPARAAFVGPQTKGAGSLTPAQLSASSAAPVVAIPPLTSAPPIYGGLRTVFSATPAAAAPAAPTVPPSSSDFSMLAQLIAEGYGAQPSGAGQSEITGSYPVDSMQAAAGTSSGNPTSMLVIVLVVIGVIGWFAWKHFHKTGA